MIAPFAVFGLVVDYAVFYFHFADVVIALKIDRVVNGIPEAPFDGACQRNALFGGGFVAQREHMHLQGFPQRHKTDEFGGEAVFRG